MQFDSFKVHISSAITFAVEGFYPKNSAGYTIPYFASLDQAIPIISLIISTISGSFGMTNFFLKGPIPILSNNAPMGGIISFPFACTLLLNTMFIARILFIEKSFFTSYRYQYSLIRIDHNGIDHAVERTIDPIIPAEYRLLAYFTPVFISFMINLIKLVGSGTKFVKCIRKYPQILIASCFTPFMFEGCKGDSIRIWKFGTVINALFIGCLPQIIMLCMEFYRGIISWDFIGTGLRKEGIYENNDALFKNRYGHCMFASISGILYLLLIIFTFSVHKIFPQNIVNFSKALCLSPTLEITSIPTNDEEYSIFYMHRYSNASVTLIKEDPIYAEHIKSKEVYRKFGYNFIES